jgi:hypothetical protein
MKFIRGQVEKSYKSTMLATFFDLPFELELLEGNIHDHDAPPNGELAMLGPHEMLIISSFSIGS